MVGWGKTLDTLGRKSAGCSVRPGLARPAPSQSVGLAGLPGGGCCCSARRPCSLPSGLRRRRHARRSPPGDPTPRRRIASVVGSTAAPVDVNAIDDIVTAEATEVLGVGGGEIGLAAVSGGYVPEGVGEDDQSQLIRFGATVAWPTTPRLSRAPGRLPARRRSRRPSRSAAAALGLGVGDGLALVSRDDPGQAGVGDDRRHLAAGPRRPVLAGPEPELDGVETRGPFTTTGPLVVDRADLVDRVGGRELDLEWRAIPDVNSLRVGGLNALREDLETLCQRLRDDRLPGRAPRRVGAARDPSPRSTGGRSSAAAASRC